MLIIMTIYDNIKQLLDEAEHDIKTEVNVICRSEAEADNIDRGLNNY